jgi:dermatan/chondrotin sulfate uronyl 2-O-sulfotransferase UST
VLLRNLSKRNKFHYQRGELHHNARELTRKQQERLVAHLASLPSPSYYNEHFHNIDWRTRNLTVNLVNMIRDPIDRVVSHFYYVEKIFFGGRKSYRLDDCVLSGAARCRVGGTPTRWGYTGIEMALSFFCGQWPVCTQPKSRVALARALTAMETEYSVVGVLEQLNTSLAVMEALLPRWFLGASSLYQRQPILQNRNPHPEPGPRARALLEERLGMDIEFHKAVTQRLHWQWNKIRGQWSDCPAILESSSVIHPICQFWHMRYNHKRTENTFQKPAPRQTSEAIRIHNSKADFLRDPI